MNRPSMFGRTVQESDIWLKELREELHLEDENQAYGALRAVLHALRDRLTVDETAHLAAQMPTLVRGIYYEGWKPSANPQRIRSGNEFVETVRERARGHDELDPDFAIRGVFKVLGRHVDPGEVGDVTGQLPADLRGFWQSPQA